MDVYSIGEEKCIDGVWGRSVGNRFYNFITSVTSMTSEGGLSRKISVDSVHQFYAVFIDDVLGGHEYMLAHPDMRVEKYIPKHITDLENLKRGDIVWVFIEGSWKTVTFWHRTAADITCVLEFSYSGLTYPHSYIVVEEVVIERPFTI